MRMDWEFVVLDFIQNYLTSAFGDIFMPFVSSLGNGGLIWIFIGVLLLTRKKYRKGGIAVLLGLLVMLVLGDNILKPWIARLRPFQVHPKDSLLILAPSGYSFPSGHTFSSFTAATILLWTDKKIGIPAFILASFIGFSRLYLYVHFPSDVLVGIILGLAVGTVTWKIVEEYIFKKRNT